MADVALTEIRHGLAEGEILVFPQGTPVSKMGDLGKDTIAELKAVGAIGAPDTAAAAAAEEVAALQAQVEELRAARGGSGRA